MAYYGFYLKKYKFIYAVTKLEEITKFYLVSYIGRINIYKKFVCQSKLAVKFALKGWPKVTCTVIVTPLIRASNLEHLYISTYQV